MAECLLVSDVTQPWELCVHCPLCECCFFILSLPIALSLQAGQLDCPIMVDCVAPDSATAVSWVFIVRVLIQSGYDERT